MTISTSTLTSEVEIIDGVVTGEGVFDDLMETVNTHLENQFQLGRITSTDYATVYLGALQSTIQQSVQFTLNKATANAQVSLTDKQALTEVAKELLVDAQTSTEGSNKNLIDEQINETQEKVDLLQSQDLEVIAATTRQDSLVTAQISDITNQSTNRTAAQTTNENSAVKQRLLHVAQTSLADSQTEATTTDTVNKKLTTRAELYIAEQNLISEKIKNGEEISQYLWEVEYIDNPNNTYTFPTIQNLTDNDVIARLNYDPHVAGYTVNTVVLNQVTLVKDAGESLVGAQIKKTEEEVDVLQQKAVTEYAQTQQTTKAVPNSDSLIGRQSTLFEQQANGFKWDAQNTHNQNLVNLDKMRMTVSGLVSSSGNNSTAPGEGYEFSISDPTDTSAG